MDPRAMNLSCLFERYPDGMSPEQRVFLQAGITSKGTRFVHRSVTREQLAGLPCPSTEAPPIPVGGVPFVRAWMDRLDLKTSLARSRPGTYPTSLYKYLRRSTWTCSLQEALALARDRALFIKPAHGSQVKAFTGQVVGPGGRISGEIAAFRDIEERFAVWCAPPVTFQAEYRAYICRGVLQGIARYDNSLNTRVPPPDQDVLAAMIADFTAAPAGYAIDVGIAADGETVLVEVNDGWALGYYIGVDPQRYVATLQARWDELWAGRPHPEEEDRAGPGSAAEVRPG